MIISIIIAILLLYIMYDVVRLRMSEKIMCNNNDGQCYKISDKFKDHDRAMHELSRINNFNANFIKYLRNKYIWQDSKNEDMKRITMNLIKNYNPDVLKENNPTSTKNTSYVLEKGQSIAFCLREKDSGKNKIENNKMLDFVNLHEISHLAMSFHDPKHTAEFWRTFKLLLREAEAAKLYEPINWSEKPQNYCGLTVDYNPIYDENIKI